MFTEKEMSDALKWLFDLFQPEDYEAYDEEEVGCAALCLPEVCMALRDKAETAYEYVVKTNIDRGFEYRGKELFMQRACLIYSDIEIGIYDMTDTSYNRELWLLEDMSFALVHNVSMVIKSGDFYYATEYRSIVKLLKERDDLFFTPESLTEELEEMCIPQWENEATIYELCPMRSSKRFFWIRGPRLPESARCSGIRRFTPSIVTMESKMLQSAGRSHRRRII